MRRGASGVGLPWRRQRGSAPARPLGQRGTRGSAWPLPPR